ncbi:MAG: exodeoxyribonuclease VII large subunit [Pseudomonadales bacterium]|jgi:exodeoxyribonuclease VII large subunit|nr:exodeoxyribonuclease VII large subunit [Pseudomonadales bacterium]
MTTDAARPDATRRVLTPSLLNAEAQVVLEENFGVVWIEGELSNFSRPASGHWYFTLKDRNAQVRCAMFRGRNGRVRFTPEAGMHVLLRARVSLYVGRGEFQLVVDSMEPAGEGALRLAFEQLRRRLGEEGLFDAERKRALPALPRRIALVTSPTGAAIRDLLSVLARRWPAAEIVVVATAVQGDAATAEIVRAFERIARACERGPALAPDLVIVGRGGGSMEDLWCFNEEAVARAIAACPVPVVSAVGHETDYTIADFVADLRAPTPSAAAELVTPDAAEWRVRVRNLGRALRAAQRRRLDAAARELAQRRARLRDPAMLIAERTQRVDELALRLERRADEGLARRSERLRALQRRLAAASPERRLQREARLLSQLTRRLAQTDPRQRIRREAERLTALERRLAQGEAQLRSRAGAELRRLAGALQALSPLAVVDRGYALLTRPAPPGVRFGEAVTDATGVTPGETIEARLARGRLTLQVTGADPDAE